MRCLIYAKTKDTAWLRDYFPDIEPYLLKIVNKPLLEYAMDFASLLGVNELRIVTDSSTKDIEAFFGTGAKWGVKTSYGLAFPNDSLKTVYLKNMAFCKDDDLLIWNGFFFLLYDQSKLCFEKEFSQAFYTGSKRFIYLPKDFKLLDLKAEDIRDPECLETKDIASITQYYELSMNILKKHNEKYVLPGYSNEKDTFLGLNLGYPHSSEIHPPIMIGNNCRFQRNTLIGGNSIIGNNVIIDENTCVTDSIVYDNTYIGKDLDMDKKIVYKGYLTNAENGEVININDKVLVAQVEPGIVTSMFNRAVQRILALVLFVLQIVPWLILYVPFALFGSSVRTDKLLNRNMRSREFVDSEKLQSSLWGRFLLRLSLDKFDKVCAAAFTKELYLVGNRLFTNTLNHRKLINELPAYNPGAFSLAESVASRDTETEIFYELEYINYISTHHNLKILGRTILRRLIHGCAGFDGSKN